MTAQLIEVLMGLGSFDFSFRSHADELPRQYEHVLVYEGAELIFTGPVLRRSRAARTFGGAGMDWWLGQDSDGPLIEDREYISGHNKLSNGGFEDAALFWRVDEDPLWEIRSADGEPRTGSWAAALTAAPADDEPLQSDESFETQPGDLISASVYAKRSAGTVGRLRCRVVFTGRFRPANLLDGVTWTDESLYAGDATQDTDDLILGPVTKRQVIVNGGFETGDLTHWIDGTPGSYVLKDSTSIGALGVFEGNYVVTVLPMGAGQDRQLVHGTAYPVVSGEKMFLQGRISAWAENPSLTVHADGYVTIGAFTVDEFGGNLINHQTLTLDINENTVPGWATVSEVFEVEEGQTGVLPYIRGTEVTAGEWAFDEIILSHLENNFAVLRSDTFTVQPKRTYRLMASVISEEDVQGGTLKAVVTFTATGRDPIIQDSSAMEHTENVDKLFSQDFTVPSGYTTAQIDWVVKDVANASFRIRKNSISFRDTNTSTLWVDAVETTNPASYTHLVNDTTTPDGAERYHLEVIAEQGDAGWRVDDCDVHRRETASTGEDIVAELLKDPDTGDQLVPEGTIHAAGVIEYDWRLRNLTDRDALKHLSRSGLTDEAREWRIQPDGSADWGTATEIFTDRDDFILAEGDLKLIGEGPKLQEDYSQRLTAVKTIGADRTPVGGQRRLITGTAAAAPDAEELDWFGNPVKRTRLVEDSTIETFDHAAGRAAIELEKNGTPAEAARYKVSDWRVAGTFDVGDTIYAYHPDAGLVDETNERTADGRTIWPAAKRVLSRTRRFGAGFRLEIRGTDGTIRDVTDLVEWETETSADVQLGDLLPEFAVDSQGGAVGQQFRRFRAATSR